jgi:hypothetical protein
MKDDRGFRFLVGCFVIFAAWKLYHNGWFDLFFGAEVSGTEVGNADLVGLAVQSLISAIDGIGLVAILLVSGAWPTIEGILRSIIKLLTPGDEANDG